MSQAINHNIHVNVIVVFYKPIQKVGSNDTHIVMVFSLVILASDLEIQYNLLIGT